MEPHIRNMYTIVDMHAIIIIHMTIELCNIRMCMWITGRFLHVITCELNDFDTMYMYITIIFFYTYIYMILMI